MFKPSRRFYKVVVPHHSAVMPLAACHDVRILGAFNIVMWGGQHEYKAETTFAIHDAGLGG